MTGGAAALLFLAICLLATVMGVALYIYYGRLIMRSRIAGTPVSFGRMIKMTLSGLDANALVYAYLDARKAGLQVTLDELETVARNKGDVRAAVKTIAAKKE